MSVHTEVTIICDRCVNVDDEIVAPTLKEAKQKARDEGWKLTSIGDFCPEHFDDHGRWAERTAPGPNDYRESYDEEAYQERLRSNAKREAIKATECPRCGAGVNEKCRSATGKVIDPWFQSHAVRQQAAVRLRLATVGHLAGLGRTS